MKKGFYTALGTPLNPDGSLCREGMTAQIEQQIEVGASGLLVMGSMGIEAYLKNATYPTVAACSVEAAKGAAPVLVGVTDVSIARVMDRIDALKGIKGIDGVVSTVPYYAACTQGEIFTFYDEIAKRSPWPVYLYDLAVVTKTATAPSTVQKLWKNLNIKGIKSGNLVTHRVLMQAEDRPADFTQMFSNIDEFDVAYKYGIDKNLDGMFSCAPKTSQKVYAALAAGEDAAAAKYLNDILNLRDLFLTTPCLMMAYSHAMNLLGCPGRYGMDYQPDVPDADKERVAAALRAMGEI